MFAGGLACLHLIYILFMVFGSLSGKPIFRQFSSLPEFMLYSMNYIGLYNRCLNSSVE